MAKIAFTKLGLTMNKATKVVKFKEQEIEVKQYLPVNSKLELISNVINLSADDNNFANPMKVSVYAVLEILQAYTNINFTDKQKEDPCKIYDLFVGNGLSTIIMSAIPEAELAELLTGIEESIAAIYNYRNSVMGILDIVSSDYSNLKLDATEIQNQLNNGEGIELLKSVMTKLG